MSPPGDPDRLVLLPAVDIAGGQAVQLVQGVPGRRSVFGDPRGRGRALAGRRRRVDPPGRPGRRLRPRQQRRDHRRSHLQATDQRRAVRGHPRRRNPGARARHWLRPGQHRHGRTGESRRGARRSSTTHGDRIAIGLDVRGTKLAARGWTREGGDLYETLQRLDRAGCARFVVTDVNSDGMLAGPNLNLLAGSARRRRSRSWPAAGSPPSKTSSALAEMVPQGVEGAIIGTALYVGQLHHRGSADRRQFSGRATAEVRNAMSTAPADSFPPGRYGRRPAGPGLPRSGSTAGCATCWPARRS